MNGMDRHLAKKARDDKEMCRIFFKDGKSRSDPSVIMMMDILKDHVPKRPGCSVASDRSRRSRAMGRARI